MKPDNFGNRGFTLIESMIALAISGAFLLTVISAWTFSTKIWKEESVRSNLRVNIEQTMERVKEDVRLSDGNKILFYPSTATSYTAFSLPRATPNVSGFLTLSSGSISWDRTVIYHVYNNSGVYELRRTTLPTFNSSVATRQANLDTAATTGTVSGGTTRTIFKAGSGTTFEIVPSNATFDGYSASTNRSSNTSFGSIQLTSGTHQIRFESTSKNASATSYGMGIDSFALSPSGCLREAEELTVSASSGDSATNEVTTGFTSSVWGGNTHKNYASNAAGDYITFDAYYDLWLESNFDNMTHSNTESIGTNPYLTIASRETQGLTPNWQATNQTLSGTEGDEVIAGARSIRTVISGQYTPNSTNMIRFKFVASSSADLVVNSAYFGVRQGREVDGDGTSNFSSGTTQLYFDNAEVLEGGVEGVGVVGSGAATSKTIHAGYQAWTNWMEYDFTAGSGAADFLISMNVPSGSAGQILTQVSGTPPTHSYRITDTGANVTSNWSSASSGWATSSAAFGVVQTAGWVNVGTATSQVYDTVITAPTYGQLTWVPTLPAGSTLTMKIRTSASSDMTGATAWSAVTSRTVTPSSIAALTSQRYVQFQAILQAASPYTSLPSVENVQITWPGQSAFVEISGYFTKKPSYGIFKVLVDGLALTKRLEIKLTASQAYRGTTYTSSLNSEEEPRNTGK